VVEPRFVTFEGVEGCGKSTQLRLLEQALRARGVSVVVTREPGGTPLGVKLRRLLLDPAVAAEPLTELLLLLADRAQHVARVIRPALAAGSWVLSDRFADSSMAYQGVARGLGATLVRTLNEVACQEVWPDRTIVVDLPVAEALTRARRRRTTTARNRRFEDLADGFHRAVADAYRGLAEAEPSRVRIVSGSGSVTQVHQRVLDALADVLG
jgi:dTMP kinase